jgi:hypothetical protein
VIWGPLKFPGSDGHGHAGAHDESHEPSELPPDITGREIAILVPLAVLVIAIGILPTHLMRPMEGPVQMIYQPLAVAPKQSRPELRRPAVSMNRQRGMGFQPMGLSYSMSVDGTPSISQSPQRNSVELISLARLLNRPSTADARGAPRVHGQDARATTSGDTKPASSPQPQ